MLIAMLLLGCDPATAIVGTNRARPGRPDDVVDSGPGPDTARAPDSADSGPGPDDSGPGPDDSAGAPDCDCDQVREDLCDLAALLVGKVGPTDETDPVFSSIADRCSS